MEIKSMSKKEQYNLCIYLYNSIKMPLRFFDGTRQIFSLPQGEQILSLAHLTPNMISLTQTLSCSGRICPYHPTGFYRQSPLYKLLIQ